MAAAFVRLQKEATCICADGGCGGGGGGRRRRCCDELDSFLIDFHFPNDDIHCTGCFSLCAQGGHCRYSSVVVLLPFCRCSFVRCVVAAERFRMQHSSSSSPSSSGRSHRFRYTTVVVVVVTAAVVLAVLRFLGLVSGMLLGFGVVVVWTGTVTVVESMMETIVLCFVTVVVAVELVARKEHLRLKDGLFRVCKIDAQF